LGVLVLVCGHDQKGTRHNLKKACERNQKDDISSISEEAAVDTIKKGDQT